GTDDSVCVCETTGAYTATEPDDCDDEDDDVHPDATEVCDGLDNDCDGQVDDGMGSAWYADYDGDGYGDPDVSESSCEGATGFVDDDSDCDDDNETVNPGADETCDGEDQDCDGEVDEEASDTLTWYADTDGDGARDDELVFSWSGSSSAFQSTVTGAIEDLVTSIRFSSVSLQVDGDEWGFVTAIDPESYDDISPSDAGSSVDFTLSFRGVVAATTEDALYTLSLNVLGDDSILLDTLDIIVVVPGTSY
ncbi:MAG: putative metal-binding motif-containing protein, partial [Myxococcota bacterium]|nr:putative metal-binding motif-containing protein [Myxococcota bacterium]